MKEKNKVQNFVISYVVLFLMLSIITKLLSGYNLGQMFTEVVLLLTMSLLFLYLSKEKDKIEKPFSFMGKALSTVNKRERNNIYLSEGMIIGTLVSVINVSIFVILSPKKTLIFYRFFENFESYNLLINTLILFVLVTLITFGLECYFCEKNVRNYLSSKKDKNKTKKAVM